MTRNFVKIKLEKSGLKIIILPTLYSFSGIVGPIYLAYSNATGSACLL